MEEKIYITGAGIISAIGMGWTECSTALQMSKAGIGRIKHLSTRHRDAFVVGEVDFSNHQLMELLQIKESQQKGYSRTALLGCIAVKEAITQAALNAADLRETALVSGTTVGGMDITEKEWDNPNSDWSFVASHPCGDSTDKICDLTGISGYRTTLSTACSSGANAIIHGIRLIRSGRAKRVIAGGVDALSKFTLNGFNSLMIVDPEHCKPFDAERKGLNLGEGAGFVVLESESSAIERGKTALCEITGFANANDAYHQTASSPDGEGAFLAMTKALETAKITPVDISYINAHGTGTENNDSSESAAIQRVFGSTPPPFSSTKAFTGHTLGAAAGIEAVISVMALQNQMIFPSLNFKTPMEGVSIKPYSGATKHHLVNHVLSNSFGFGGNNSALIFSKV
jgi:3-oxoacyl-[acyl-carrier-protein] synthase-1